MQAYIGEHDRACYNDTEIRQPRGRSGEGVSRSTNIERNQLDSPQPTHALPADRKESDVEEEESRHGMMRALCAEI
jgi:hypothetical protein